MNKKDNMDSPLRLLLIDDNPDDRALTLRGLKKEFEIQVREIIDAEGFASALKEGDFDIAITDYQLRWSNGLEILGKIKARYPDCPVIMFTGTGNEEIAVEAMKDGLDDYVIKSPKHFIRLPAAMKTAITKAQQHKAMKQTEAALRESETQKKAILDASIDRIRLADMDMRIIWANETHARDLNIAPEDIVGKACYEVFAGRNTPCPECPAQKALKSGKIEHTVLVRPVLGNTDEKTYLDSYAVPIKDESGQIVNVLQVTRDITEQVLAEKRLQESEEFNSALFEYNPIQTVVVDTEGRITRVNLAKKQSGDRQPVVGNVMYKDYAGKHEIDMHAELMKCLKSSKSKSFPELKYGDKTLSITIAPFYKGAIIATLDITTRKQAEEKIKASLKEKEVLLKEIHHRVKNNLQVISSLLSLQSQHIKDKASRAMFQESQDRVRSMALIHENLYISEDLSHIDIASYIRSLTHQLITTYSTASSRVSMNIAVTDIFLTITTAIPCGLIINELVTNALKHAFPHQQKGTITVSMTPSTKDSLILTVSDTGIGFPEGIDFRNTTTLGMQLVTSLVEQLEGTITLDRSEGTTFTITFRGGTV